MRASSAGGNDSPGSIRRRKSYIEVVPGGPHVLLEPVPFAEEWILVTKDIAYAGMPVYMDTPPMAFFLGAAGASLVVQTESMGRLSSHGSEASESADLPPFLQKPVSLPGSVGDESAGRDQIDDPPTPSSKGPMTPSSKGNGSKNSADRSAISDVSSDGQAGKLPLPRQLAPKSEPSSPHPAAAPTGFPNLVSEKRGLRPVGPSFSFESDGGVEELGIRKGNVSMRLENPVNLPVRLICKIVNAAQLPKPQHGTNIDPYCLLSVSQSNKKSRTRTLTNTEDPEWDEEFVYIVQDLNTCIHVEVMHKDVLKDELLGQATIRCREILDNDLNELWSKEYVLYSKQGQPTSSVLFFQFKLEPVLLDVIRFTEDEEQGRLVEPFDNDIIDIWKVRWEGSGECGWYNCGFNGVYNLRCAVEWSQAVDDFKAHHGGDDKLVRRALRPGSKEIGEEQYAKLPSHMRVNMKDVRGRSFLSKSLRIGSSAAAKRTATLGRNAARQREREREHPSDPFRTAGISAVQRLSIGIGRRLSTLFSRSPLALSPEPKGSTSSEALLNLNLKLPLHAPVQPPLRRQSLQPQRVDSLANLNKPRRFSDVNSGTLSSAGSEFGREASVRELRRESSPRSFRPSNHPLLDSAPSSAFDPHRLHSHSEEGVRMAGSGEGGEGGGVEGAGGGGGGGGGGGAGRFLSSASPPHPSSPTDHRQPAPPPLRAPAAPPPIAPPHPATEAAAASAGGEAGEAGAGAGAREAEGELPEAQAAGAKLEGEGEGEGGKEEGEEGPAKVTSRASEELDLQWRQST